MIMGEASPDISKRKRERDIKLLQQITCTPKGKKIGLDDLHLLGLHRDNSPNACGSSQDKLEIGWGDSPEPLTVDKTYTTPVACKKRLEARESPKSRCRYIRPSIRPPSKQTVDVSKYIAEVQALSKRIMKEIQDENGSNVSEKENKFRPDKSPCADVLDMFKGDDLSNDYLIACSQSLENKLAKGKEKDRRKEEKDKRVEPQQQQQVVSNDSAFEKVLQTFISEEDDWLSQAVLNAEAKITPRKNGFMKTKSENELSSPDGGVSGRRSVGSTFRRTYSSDRIVQNRINNGPYLSAAGRARSVLSGPRKSKSLGNDQRVQGSQKTPFR